MTSIMSAGLFRVLGEGEREREYERTRGRETERRESRGQGPSQPGVETNLV